MLRSSPFKQTHSATTVLSSSVSCMPRKGRSIRVSSHTNLVLRTIKKKRRGWILVQFWVGVILVKILASLLAKIFFEYPSIAQPIGMEKRCKAPVGRIAEVEDVRVSFVLVHEAF